MKEAGDHKGKKAEENQDYVLKKRKERGYLDRYKQIT